MNEHMKLLGLKVTDLVTGFAGIVTCISFDLYGCVQAIVSPGLDKEGEVVPGIWFDTKRLRVVAECSGPVMDLPTFQEVAGGQEKPQFQERPVCT